MESISKNSIEKIILENYIEYQNLFVEFQSQFLSSLHSRYQSLENGSLVLYYARQTHQDILRKKDYDLNFNLNYEKFWHNHRDTKSPRASIIKIGEDIFLPKETTRRKILQLIKQKILGKKNKNIGWFPSEEYKQSYNLFTSKEINEVSKLICFICEKKNLSISKEEVGKEVKEKFSFYWFHYLGAQLQYLKLWSIQFKDVELILIFLKVARLAASKAKENKISNNEVYNNPNILKEFVGASISATSIAEVTSIPRATCIRKLEILVKLKIIKQDKNTKRYYIISSMTADNLVLRKINAKVINLFSDFYFICIRAINTNNRR